MKNTDIALIVLVAFSIVVSIGGFIWSANVMENFPSNKLTAYGSAGYVNVTITVFTSINVTATNCDFGSGYITVGQTNATIESNGTLVNWVGSGTTSSLGIRNDGNKNLTLNVSSGKTLTQFYGVDCSGAGAGCAYNFWSTNNEVACTSGLVDNPGTAMDTTNKTACSNFRFEDGTDDMYVHCRLVVYQSIPTGAKTDTWTFWAIEN